MCRRILNSHGKYFRGSASSLPLLDSTNFDNQTVDENLNGVCNLSSNSNTRNYLPGFESVGKLQNFNNNQANNKYSSLIFVLFISISSGLTVLGMNFGMESLGGIHIVNFSVTFDAQFYIGLFKSQYSRIIFVTVTTVCVSSLVFVTKYFAVFTIPTHLFSSIFFYSKFNDLFQAFSISIPPLQFILTFFKVMKIKEQKLIMDSPSSSNLELLLINTNDRENEDIEREPSKFREKSLFKSITKLFSERSFDGSYLKNSISNSNVVSFFIPLVTQAKGTGISQIFANVFPLSRKMTEFVSDKSFLEQIKFQKVFNLFSKGCNFSEMNSNTSLIISTEASSNMKFDHIGSNESDCIARGLEDEEMNSENKICCLKNIRCDFVSQQDLIQLLNQLECMENENSFVSQPWESIVEKNSNALEYTAFRRDLPNGGPTEYYSKTKFHNCNARTLCDFYMDNEFLVEWDAIVKSFKKVHFCPQTGTEVGHYMKKYPFCSPNEYVLSWKLWKQDTDTFYCITKAIENFTEFGLELKHNQVKVYHSAWRIQKVEGENSCEIQVFAKEDCGLHRDMAKMLFRRSIWNYVKQTERQLRIYQKRENRISHSLNAYPLPLISHMRDFEPVDIRSNNLLLEYNSLNTKANDDDDDDDDKSIMHKRFVCHHLHCDETCATDSRKNEPSFNEILAHKALVRTKPTLKYPKQTKIQNQPIQNPFKFPIFLVSGAIVLANPIAPFGAKLVMISLLRSLS